MKPSAITEPFYEISLSLSSITDPFHETSLSLLELRLSHRLFTDFLSHVVNEHALPSSSCLAHKKRRREMLLALHNEVVMTVEAISGAQSRR
jgi:hypothetical protein